MIAGSTSPVAVLLALALSQYSAYYAMTLSGNMNAKKRKPFATLVATAGNPATDDEAGDCGTGAGKA